MNDYSSYEDIQIDEIADDFLLFECLGCGNYFEGLDENFLCENCSKDFTKQKNSEALKVITRSKS